MRWKWSTRGKGMKEEMKGKKKERIVEMKEKKDEREENRIYIF